MPRFNTVAIVGVGLIGGSIGLGLRRRGLAGRVVGIGYREESLRVARQRGAVTETTVDVAGGVAEADLVVVCTPVGRIVDDVRKAAQNCRPGALITDVGSTKGEIVAAIAGSLQRGVTFVGSHPLAGSERSGPAAAEADLLVDRVVVVTPDNSSRAEDVQDLADFWSSLGARVVCMSAGEHDRTLAATSHLPHLVAAALALATPPEMLDLTAGGWADTTRIASGDPELWRQIFESNRAAVLAALARFQETMGAMSAALERPDEDGLRQLLAKAKERRDAVV